MKQCPKCKLRHSDLWYKCMNCHAILVKEQKRFSLVKKKSYIRPNSPDCILEQLIEQANALIVFTTPEGEALMCNDTIEFFTGYTLDEIFQQGWLDLLYKGHDIRKEMFKAVMKGCLISIRSKTYEGAVVKKDGCECMLSWRLSAIMDKKGNKLGLLCVAHDVTERKTTEDDINVHGQKLRDILSSIREYVLMTTNLEGKITYYGLGAREIFGWPADEVYLEDISIIYPKYNRSGIIMNISQQLQQNGKFEGEVKLVRKGDVEFPAILTITPLLNKEGQTIGYTYIAKDVTEKKKMERQIIQSEKMAAVGQLASGVAHEINNPLLVILGRLDLLEEQKLPEDIIKTLDIIKSQSQRIRTIADRLLSYSKQKPPEIKPLDLNQLIQSIVPLLSYYPEFRKISWKEDFQKDIPLIKGDFNQLQEVFVNLGLNACQAMPDGGVITITTRHNRAERYAEAQVKDTGVGMSDEQIQNLFVPFFTTKDEGTGLGLAICRRIIEQHKGKIEVDSSMGKGTVFTIKLPVVD